MPAPIPHDETDRLSALHRYQLLDSDPERAFDDITQLAVTICRSKIAAISLIDTARQWLKSRVGTDMQCTHRDLAFCAYTILEPDHFVVEDTHADERFRDHPLVTGKPFIRFYAGVPLINPEGFAVGSLCIIHPEPMKLDSEKLSSLQALGRLAINEMEIRRVSVEWARTNAQVRKLSSLLSMCPHCNAIRDDRGMWTKDTGFENRHFNPLTCPQCAVPRA